MKQYYIDFSALREHFLVHKKACLIPYREPVTSLSLPLYNSLCGIWHKNICAVVKKIKDILQTSSCVTGNERMPRTWGNSVLFQA